MYCLYFGCGGARILSISGTGNWHNSGPGFGSKPERPNPTQAPSSKHQGGRPRKTFVNHLRPEGGGLQHRRAAKRCARLRARLPSRCPSQAPSGNQAPGTDRLPRLAWWNGMYGRGRGRHARNERGSRWCTSWCSSLIGLAPLGMTGCHTPSLPPSAGSSLQP
jgi:hypothetical protein